MRLTSKWLAAAAFAMSTLGATAAMAHSYTVGPISLAHPYALPVKMAGQNAAVFIEEVGNKGPAADRLISASTPAAGSVEIHSMQMQGDVMKMRQVPGVDVPAGAKIEMRHGSGDGYHLMLMQLKKPLQAGDKFPLTLVFEKAGKVEVSVHVQEASEHEHHHHH